MNDIKSRDPEIGGKQMYPIAWNDVILCVEENNDLYNVYISIFYTRCI